MSALQRLGLAADLRQETGSYSAAQKQTEDAFAFKWTRRETYDSEAVKEHTRRWLLEKYCGGAARIVDDWLSGERKILLDAGCGSAFSALLLFGERLKAVDYLGVDISDAVDVARTRFAEAGVPGDFLKANLMDLPIPPHSVDLVFSEGVLHHTDDTATAISTLAEKLKPGGRFVFYVYARKGPIREFTDDYVRAQLRSLSDEAAWEALEPLTKLGIALGRLGVEIDVPEDIPLLGIKRGKVDIQRFFYWNVCKAFYRPEFTLDEMNHINFDWFRPLNCHRHTPEELRRFCESASLTIERFTVEDAGISIVAIKRPDAAVRVECRKS